MMTFAERLRRFYDGKYYPLAAATMILLGHVLGLEIPIGAVILISLIPACLVCNDFRFGVIPFMCLTFIVSAQDYTPSDTGYEERFFTTPALIALGSMAAMLIASLVWFGIRNRKNRNPMPKSRMFWSLVILCGALFINGLFSKNYTPSNMLYVVIMALTLIVVYLLFALYFHFDKTSMDYLMYCLVIAGMLIILELTVAYFTHVQFENGEIVKGSVVLGWGVWTNIGGMLSFLMPACFYFAVSHKRGWIGYLLGLVEYLGIVLSQSRGALLVGSVVLLACLITLCLKGKNRRQNRMFTLALCVVGILGVAVLWKKLFGLVENFAEMGFEDNGRFEKWEIGWKNFVKYPIFGSGFYDSYVDPAWDMPLFPYLYHNTVIQLLGASGLCGFLAYAYHRYTTVRQILTKPSLFKTFLGFCMMGLLLFSLTDVLLFKIYPTIIYSIMLLFMVKSDEVAELDLLSNEVNV